MDNKEHNKGKTGVVPEEEISGSDADKAYDQEGNFDGESQTGNQKNGMSDEPEGSDADTDE